MINKIKLLLAGLLISLPLLSPVVASAQFNPVGKACESSTSSSEVCVDADNARTDNPITGTNSVLLTAANMLTIAAGFIAVLMIIISGIKMTTSGGDPGKVKKSRDTIIYALVGVIIVLMSQAIVRVLIAVISK